MALSVGGDVVLVVADTAAAAAPAVLLFLFTSLAVCLFHSCNVSST